MSKASFLFEQLTPTNNMHLKYNKMKNCFINDLDNVFPKIIKDTIKSCL